MLEKILVVSNSEVDCEIIKNNLTDNFVFIVNNTYEALQHLKTYSDVSLIFLDVDMPKMSGYHLLALLKMNGKYSNIRVIIISKSEQFAKMASSRELGKVDYLKKPISPEPLRLIVKMQTEIISQNNLMKKMSDTNYIFNLLFKEAPFGIAITQLDKKSKNYNPISATVNPTYERIIGRKQSDFDTYDWRTITHQDDLRISELYYDRLIRGEINSYSREKRYVRPDGSVVWVNILISAIKSDDENVFSHLSLLEDITERKRIEEDLIESERSKSVLLSHIPGLAYRCLNDRNWTMLYVSSGSKELTGYESDCFINNRDLSYNSIVAPPFQKVLWEEWKRVIKKKQKFRYAYQIITKSGGWKWVYELGEPIYDKDGKVEGLEGIVIDISQQKQMEEALQHKNDYNEWTELLNRNYLERILSEDFKNRSRKKKALVTVNLNSIQMLTSVHGYHYSQDLMKSIAEELKKIVCERCQLFLTHENRCTFYVKDYENEVDLLQLYEKIRQIVEPIVLLERISCGVGIYELPANAKPQDVDTILKNLLVASEKAYINDDQVMHYVFFDVEMENEINREKQIQKELVEVVNGQNEERLFLQYQPIIDLKRNKVCSFEALVRLRSDVLGVVPPLDFISLMERTKLIIPIGDMIIRKSLLFLKKIHDLGYEDMSVSINVSAIQLLEEHFTKKFLIIINEIGVNPDKIWVELTESLFASNYQDINSVLGRLMENGVRVAIDDFGTGFSSLYRLLAININCIKIDKAFMDGIELIKIDEAITKDIISLGQKLRYVVVAEGVESQIQRDYLVSYGCDRAQGYFFSKPLNEEDAIPFVIKFNQ
ncbi:MAG: EAL domain-containing protein [Bacilli bacterium]|jgi:PAS domain S-box-containing protein